MEDPFYTKIWEKIQAGDISTGSYLSNDGVYMVSMQQVEGTNWYLVSGNEGFGRCNISGCL